MTRLTSWSSPRVSSPGFGDYGGRPLVFGEVGELFRLRAESRVLREGLERAERGGPLSWGLEQLDASDWNLAIEFRYTPGPDWIDLEMRLMPNTAHEDFDFFFASYITEDMESTWVPALIDGNEEWRKLNVTDDRVHRWVAALRKAGLPD